MGIKYRGFVIRIYRSNHVINDEVLKTQHIMGYLMKGYDVLADVSANSESKAINALKKQADNILRGD